MKFYLIVLMILMSVRAGQQHDDKNEWKQDGSWLLSRAQTIIDNAARKTTDGITIWSPAGLPDFYSNSIYPRDFFYTYEACPECFTNEQVRVVIDWMMKRQADDGRIPNSIYMDGKPWFWLFDNSQFMVNLVYLYVKNSNDKQLFIRHAGNLERAMDWLPLDPITHLVTTKKPESMYGFQDSIQLLGDELFTSVLYFQAAVYLSELYALIDNKSSAEKWQTRAEKVRGGLQTLYNKEGFFYACSEGPNHLPAVWGTSLAVWVGATTAKQNKTIGKWMERNYEDFIQAGQVRHLLKPMWWTGPKYPKGAYQNGGYWATAFAWVNKSIRNVNPELADQMLSDILNDFQKYGINEVVNHDVDFINRAGHGGEYCGSLVPLITLRELGVKFDRRYRNLALRSNGGNIIASSTIEKKEMDSSYNSNNLIDGLYGDKHSWIPSKMDDSPWFQITLEKTSLIDMFIFGRDNYSSGILKNQYIIPNRTGLGDRNLSQIVIRTSLDGEHWNNPVYSDFDFKTLGIGENAVIKLDQGVQCRFVKVNILPNDTCIDEFEVYGVALDK